jgi:hypothetical protein
MLELFEDSKSQEIPNWKMVRNRWHVRFIWTQYSMNACDIHELDHR